MHHPRSVHPHTRYWFRPARFWIWFAAYYPVSWQGWAIFLAGAALLYNRFLAIYENSHSVSDTLIAFAPWLIAVFIAFDISTRLKGEYPSWWRRYKR